MRWYRILLRNSRFSSSTINQRMSAIRRLAQEAADNGLVDQTLANGVAKVREVKNPGVHKGNWLTREQAPEIDRYSSLHDSHGNTRSSDPGEYDWDWLAQVGECQVDSQAYPTTRGALLIVDLVGKGDRVRTVPIPSWEKVTIDEWMRVAVINKGSENMFQFG
jgi:hypothetical protein